MISVVIPTFNRREKVCRAVTSVLNQGNVDLEILVVDDGSSDGTNNSLDHLFGNRIRVLTQENAGVSAARNRAISESTGEWIAFLDSDDFWLPGKLESQLRAAKANPNARIIATDWAWSTAPSVGQVPNTSFDTFSRVNREDDRFSALLRMGGHGLWLPTWMVKHDLLKAAGGFDPSYRIAEDTKLMFEMARSSEIVVEPTIYTIRSGHMDDPKLSTGTNGYSLELGNCTLAILDDLQRWINGRRLPKSKKAVQRLKSHFLMCQGLQHATVGDYGPARSFALQSIRTLQISPDLVRAMATIVAPRLVGKIRKAKQQSSRM